MRPVQPEVFLVARPAIDYEQMAAYLREVGGENGWSGWTAASWTTRRTWPSSPGKCVIAPGSRGLTPT